MQIFLLIVAIFLFVITAFGLIIYSLRYGKTNWREYVMVLIVGGLVFLLAMYLLEIAETI